MTLKDLFISFDGRINRTTWWIAFAILLGIGVVAGIIAALIGIWFLYLASLVLLYPQSAAGAKRFHDMGQSGWVLLIGLIPFVGGLILLVWLGAVAGDPGENRFGPPQSADLQFTWA